jgi:hypothetical protein
MRLVTYRGAGGGRAGVQTGGGILDAAAILGEEPATLRELIAADRLPELHERAVEPPAGVEPIPDAKLLPPIPDPDKIVCIGLNYRSHAAEAGIDPPDEPTFFAKFRNALAPDGATVELPAASEKVDYEAEIAFVVGDAAARSTLPRPRLDCGLHAPQRPLRQGPPVRNPAMDARQGLRRIRALRSRPGDARRGGAAGGHRVRA